MTNKKRWFTGLLPFIGLLAFVHSFLLQPFTIPSESMHSTLIEGDYIVIWKPQYGYSWHSLFLASFFAKNDNIDPIRQTIRNTFGKSKFFKAPVKRGDVVVFTGCKFWPGEYFIKRVIGLPGDKISVRDGVININDEPCELKQVDDYIFKIRRTEDEEYTGLQYEEKFPDSNNVHKVVYMPPFGSGFLDNMDEIIVPDEHYFMMGDNRDMSGDSREFGRIGFVHEDSVIGRAIAVCFSSQARWYEIWKWHKIRFNRIPKMIN